MIVNVPEEILPLWIIARLDRSDSNVVVVFGSCDAAPKLHGGKAFSCIPLRQTNLQV